LSSTKKRILAFVSVLLALVVVACANEVDMGEVKDPGPPPSSFTPDAAGDTGDATDAPNKVLACTGTKCPAGFTTCIATDGPTFKCGTDLRRDPDHCGACNNKCPFYPQIHVTSRCLDSACALECYTPAEDFGSNEWRNCNGLIDDGCESDVLNDPKNCGGCGNACGPGVTCFNGKCGCPAGKTYCNGFCVDTKTDDNNCGACNVQCDPFPPGACSPMPPGSRIGCVAGTCGKKKCEGDRVDCNGDLVQNACTGNGCEVESLMDPNNCGACGNKCTGAGVECVDEGNGPECAVPCARFGKSRCDSFCVDLSSDPNSCGSCDNFCPRGGPNQIRACTKGRCAYECAPGFADCNGDPSDGCEVNLKIHQSHCGACGNECNIAIGQPCIDGQCLMVECDAGVAR